MHRIMAKDIVSKSGTDAHSSGSGSLKSLEETRVRGSFWHLPSSSLPAAVGCVAPAHQRLHIERASKPHRPGHLILVIKLAAPSAKIRIHITHLAGLHRVQHNIQIPRRAAFWVINARMPPTAGLIVHELT